jgi:hypothetical protein
VTTEDEVNAVIMARLEALDRGFPLRERLPVHDPVQLSRDVISGDTSPLDDVLRRFRLHGLGVSSAF